jgi:DNA end-binding protein Ku
MHTRERIVAVEPRGRGLLLTTLRSHDEIRDEEGFFRGIPATRPKKEMLAIAEKIIDQQAEAFDPSDFTDRYEDALRKIIKRKQKGQKISAPPVEKGKVDDTDLLAALRQSLKGGVSGKASKRKSSGGTSSDRKSSGRRTARRKTAAPRSKARKPTRRRAAA